MSAQHILDTLLSRLWDIYRKRVEYARQYAELVESRGGDVVNDHIAFRTFNTYTGSQPAGIAAIERVFLPLGYRPAGEYVFPDMHLSARHFQHADPLAPKIFISQLEVDQLPPAAAEHIREAVSDARDRLDPSAMYHLDEHLSEAEVSTVADQLVLFFTSLPWPLPRASLVCEINQVSQYAAWTLLHGNNVNHFTAYINEQNVPEWPNIETTIVALQKAGVPMKAEIEGEPGSKLRQTATQASDVDCPVLDDDGKLSAIRWAYAYYELAERGEVTDETGRRVRFQGFLGPQAAQLFEMTRR
jgi:hypothetical protein